MIKPIVTYKSPSNFLFNLVMAVVLDTILFLCMIGVYWYYFTFEGVSYRVHKMYQQIVAQAGQSQDALPLTVVDLPIVNAYNDGTKVVIYTGLISNTKSWDEVALVLGHELAHSNLGHLDRIRENITAAGVQVLEGNADKLGAVYMIKAGYDICKGRNLFKHWREEKGNALGTTHPDYSYRYEELNIGCD